MFGDDSFSANPNSAPDVPYFSVAAVIAFVSKIITQAVRRASNW